LISIFIRGPASNEEWDGYLLAVFVCLRSGFDFFLVVRVSEDSDVLGIAVGDGVSAALEACGHGYATEVREQVVTWELRIKATY